MRRQRPISPARWLIVILLTVIATCLLMQLSQAVPSAHAQDEVGAGGAGGVFAVAGKVTPEAYGIYLVNYRNGTICMYQYLPGSRRLRLMAARTYVFDTRLENYNTEPDVAEIKKLVSEQRSYSGAATRP